VRVSPLMRGATAHAAHRCLDILREKKQRTVYRVTLLKGYNMTCVQEYAALIKRGRPTFVVSRPFPSWNRSILAEIYLCHACSCREVPRTETAGQEIKGVTFCGDSKASSMTMANVPFHEEVTPPPIILEQMS
jgi:tRNA wybutosine-synthesizing protein 1